jgi:hypothetical protein
MRNGLILKSVKECGLVGEWEVPQGCELKCRWHSTKWCHVSGFCKNGQLILRAFQGATRLKSLASVALPLVACLGFLLIGPSA